MIPAKPDEPSRDAPRLHPGASHPGAPPRGAERLADALQRLSQELSQRSPPAAVERAVLAPWQAAARPVPAAAGRAPRLTARRPWAAAAWSGGVIVACALLLWPRSPSAPAAAAEPGFVAVAERWPEATAPAWLVPAELPRERLAQWGLPFDPGRAGDTVRAELLVRASGEVLAVRVLGEPVR